MDTFATATASVCHRPAAMAAGVTCRIAAGLVAVALAGSVQGQEPAAEVLPLPPIDFPAAEPAGRITAETDAEREGGGVFLPSGNAMRLWDETLATVSAGHVIARAEPPDFTAVPPRPGIIESAWVEPTAGRGSGGAGWPPRRQRVVVRVVPAAGGAWVEGIVETQVLSGASPESETSANSLPLDVLDGIGRVGHWEPLPAPPQGSGLDPSEQYTASLVARMAPGDMVAPLPSLESQWQRPPAVPWADSRFPRVSRAGYKILEDYRNFYSCESLTGITAAFGAGALMANTGFDETLQNAWQQSVTPSDIGTFFSGCKDVGEGRYVLPIVGAAAVAGSFMEGRAVGDAVGQWGSRSLRIFVVGAPPLYVLQMATGASRPGESPADSKWVAFNDNNGVSGHAFIGAIPFLAAAGMVEGPLAKGSLYVCSTFVAFSRVTDDAHYPSQAFLGWYLAFASAAAVNETEMHFAGMQVNVMPIPIYGGGTGMGFETRW